jgi:hypothetical protein
VIHYEVIDYDTGEVVDLKPEYTTMSRRPGIAGDWFDKYKDDVYPSDTIHLSGREPDFDYFFLFGAWFQLIGALASAAAKVL